MGRKILFVTTDQQRYDALGCNGGTIARTPVVDRLAATGINYRRAHNQNVVCMPARSTMLTGQYVRTHGVYANGVPLPADAPSVAAVLEKPATARRSSARRTSSRRWTSRPVVREPHGREGSTGPHRGFDHWSSRCTAPRLLALLASRRPSRTRRRLRPLLSAQGGGDTGAPQVAYNPIPREHYHTDWVADRTIAWLDCSIRRTTGSLDELPRPAPSVGSAGVREASRALAGPRPAAGSSRLARHDRRRSSARSRATGSSGTRAASATTRAAR